MLSIRDISMPLQIRCLAAVVIMLASGSDSLADGVSPTPRHPQRQERSVAGWRLLISETLLNEHAAATARAIELLEKQLEEIVRVVPSDAVAKLKALPLYFSATYAGVDPKAEYHPAAGWLREHGRDPSMEKAVEFTNVLIFEAETRRMPNFALHELAHACHDSDTRSPRLPHARKTLASGCAAYTEGALTAEVVPNVSPGRRGAF